MTQLRLVDALKPRTYAAGDSIVTQGELGSEFFVIEDGSADVFVRTSADPAAAPLHVRTLHAGDVFGEMALLRRCPRTATVVANGPVRVVVMVRAGCNLTSCDCDCIQAESVGTNNSHRTKQRLIGWWTRVKTC